MGCRAIAAYLRKQRSVVICAESGECGVETVWKRLKGLVHFVSFRIGTIAIEAAQCECAASMGLGCFDEVKDCIDAKVTQPEDVAVAFVIVAVA